MDENPVAASDYRLLGLIAAILIGSILGMIVGVVACLGLDEMAFLGWGEVRGQRITLCLFGGLIIGALAGFGLFELIKRPRPPKDLPDAKRP